MENPTFTPLIIYGSQIEVIHQYLVDHYSSKKFIYFEIEAQTNTIKLDQIHQLKTNLAITSTKPRLIWIKQAHLATQAAQNALLKTLEEPPNQTLFILTTNNLNKLLPTIISRCRLQHLSSQTNTPNQELLDQLKKLLHQSLGERLAELSHLPKDRTQALAWIDEIITSLNLAQRQTNDLHQLHIFSKIIKPALQTKQYLQANLNPNLALTNFLLSLPTVNH